MAAALNLEDDDERCQMHMITQRVSTCTTLVHAAQTDLLPQEMTDVSIDSDSTHNEDGGGGGAGERCNSMTSPSSSTPLEVTNPLSSDGSIAGLLRKIAPAVVLPVPTKCIA